MKKRLFFFWLLFFSMQLIAQEDETGREIIAKTSSWYASPWVWVAGAALVIILLVAMTRDKKE